jgi:hypothetical protein
MLIITDRRIPEPAKQSLTKFGEVVEFHSEGITYDAISGHPDIFFCQTPAGLIVAPNTPEHFIELLQKFNLQFTFGSSFVGASYPDSARYNALITEKYLFHHLSTTDPEILAHCSRSSATSIGADIEKLKINLNQGYTNCNLQYLGNNAFLTTDKGIWNKLTTIGLKTTLVSPSGILLPGMKYGFIGGCCGLINQTLFFLGKLQYHQEGELIRLAAEEQGLNITELYDGPLFDGGGILFI